MKALRKPKGRKGQHYTASQLYKEFANRNWSHWGLNHFFVELINQFPFGVDVAKLDHAIIVAAFVRGDVVSACVKAGDAHCEQCF